MPRERGGDRGERRVEGGLLDCRMDDVDPDDLSPSVTFFGLILTM